MQSLQSQKQADTKVITEISSHVPLLRVVSTLEAAKSRSEMIVEMRERFSHLAGEPLPSTLAEAQRLEERLKEKLTAVSRAHAILDVGQTCWNEPIKTGWLTEKEQLDRIVKRNALVYYPLRVVAELLQPLNLVTAQLVIAVARAMGTQEGASSVASSPEISIPALVGGSIVACVGLGLLYRSWSKQSIGTLSNPNVIAGLLAGKVGDLVDNSRMKAMRKGKLELKGDPEIAAHAAVRWDKDAEICMAKIAETSNLLHAHEQELQEAREILAMHRHITLAHEAFRHHARDLGFATMSPDEALSVFAVALASAPEALQQRVCEWLYHFVSVTEESGTLSDVAPDFLKVGPFANAELVRAWKLFVNALNTQEPQARPGMIYAVLNALEELKDSSTMPSIPES